MMYTLDDLTNKGEVCIVLRPHQMPCKVLSYVSVDDAFNSWKDKGIFCIHNNFAEFCENFAGDDDFIEHSREKLESAGIDPKSSFCEFSVSDTMEADFIPCPVDKLDLLQQLVDDDMYGSHVFVADGQSYREWIDEIYRYTRGHNEPSVGKIMDALRVEEDEEEEE